MDHPVVLETRRLRLCTLSPDSPADRRFVIELLNDRDFLRFIGDRGVRDDAQAEHYLSEGPRASYLANGYGLYRIERKQDGVAIGMCGLVRRAALPGADLGYALLPAYRGQGYVAEAGTAVLQDAHGRLGMDEVLAVVDPANAASIRCLRALGFHYREPVRLSADDIELQLFAWQPERRTHA